MTLTLSMHLPDELRGHEEEIAQALTHPLQGMWDETHTYENAHQPKAIAAVLIEAIHTHLRSASIGYLFREKMKTKSRAVWGKASKAGPKIEFLADHDFIVEFSWEDWRLLSPMQRVALVDHELEHCGLESNAKGERDWCMVPHDIEEFGSIVRRWGLWRQELVPFAHAVVHAHQLGLFEGALD